MAAVYILYIFASIAITVAAAETLRRYGLVVLGQYFRHHPDLAHSINHLLVTGFYLVNLGAAGVVLPRFHGHSPYDGAQAVEFMGTKYGIVICLLAASWAFNVFFLTRFRCFLIKPPKAAVKKEKSASRIIDDNDVIGKAFAFLWDGLVKVFEDDRPKPAIRSSSQPQSTVPVPPLQAVEEVQALCPPMTQLEVEGFIHGMCGVLAGSSVSGETLAALARQHTRESFCEAPAFWIEMMAALKGGSRYLTLAQYFLEHHDKRTVLRRIVGGLVYGNLKAKD